MNIEPFWLHVLLNAAYGMGMYYLGRHFGRSDGMLKGIRIGVRLGRIVQWAKEAKP